MRSQQDPRAYSPEYSSPFSSHSLLQARFTQESPRNKKYGQSTKENFLEAPLPIFQENASSRVGEGKDIPQLTVASSETGAAAILSDMSDELLIKQLQLNMNDQKVSQGVSANFNTSSNVIFEHSSAVGHSQPFAERTNQHSPAKEILVSMNQVAHHNPKQQSVCMPSQKRFSSEIATEPKFVKGKTQSHNWKNRSSPGKKPKSPTKSQSKDVKSSLVTQKVRQTSNYQQPSQQQKPSASDVSPAQTIERIEYAPMPHPAPVMHQRYLHSEITDTFDKNDTQTVTTFNKETSPAISQDDQFVAFVHTDSSQKLEKLMMWSSASPMPHGQKLMAGQDDCDAILVNKFDNDNKDHNSTIQEQPTEEQLQASGTATMINYKESKGSFVPKQGQQQHMQSSVVEEPQILAHQPVPYGQFVQQQQQEGGVAMGIDSESLEQINMINQAMQCNFPTNYSPDKSHDNSSSLHDFSVNGQPPVIAQSNDYLNEKMLVDFDKNLGQAVFHPPQHSHLSNTSIAAHRDSASTCMNARQVAMTHFIHAQLQAQADEASGRNLKPKGADSTLLNTNEKSLCSANGKMMAADSTPQGRQALSSRPVSSRQQSAQKSPLKRSSIYGACLAPSEGFYQPVLRNSSKGKPITARPEQQNKQLSQSLKGLPAKIDFINSAQTSAMSKNQDQPGGKNITSNPRFVSPQETLTVPIQRGMAPQIDSRASMRRSLETQLASAKASLSPDEKQRLTHKYNHVTSKVAQYLDAEKQLHPSRQEENASLMPAPKTYRSRNNDSAEGTRSLNTANTHREVATQKQAKPQQRMTKTPQQQPQKQSPWQHSGSYRPNRNTKISPNTRTSITPKSKSPTPRARQTISASSSRPLFDQVQKVPVPQAQPSVQLKASPYQLRRCVETMKNLEIQMFLDLERIKKPSAAVLAIARMSCIFFEALRNRDQIILEQVETMQSWQQIQEYMRTQLTCCVPELRTLLKQKTVTLGRISGEDSSPREPIQVLACLTTIWETFFIESKVRVIRRFIQTSKLMRGLVQLIYAFLCLALNLEREFNFDNLLGLTEQPSTKIEEVKVLFAPAMQPAISSHHSAEAMSKQDVASQQNKRAKSRDRSLEIQNITIDQSNSMCSKCSCNLKANSRSFASRASGARSAKSRQSADRSPAQNANSTIELQMQAFRTLDAVNVEQNSYQSKHSTVSYQQQQQQRDQRLSGSGKQHMMSQLNGYLGQSGSAERATKIVSQPFQVQPPQMLTVNNYTTLQLGKPQQTKQKRSAQPNDLQQVMTILEDYSGSGERIVSPQAQQRFYEQAVAASSRPSTSGRQKQGKDIRGKRKSNVSAGSDFASIVRASATTSRCTPKSGFTARTKPNQVTPKQATTSPALTSRQTTQRGSKPQNIQKYTAAPSKKEERVVRRDVSPVTPTSDRRYLQKTASSRNSISQKRLTPIQGKSSAPLKTTQPSVGSKHQRTSTLYKPTMSQQAKQKTPLAPQAKQILQRDSSSKGFTKSANLNQSRKTKSQVNLKQITQRSTTPKSTTLEQQNHLQQSQHVKQSKRDLAQRNLESLKISQLIHEQQQQEMVVYNQVMTFERNDDDGDSCEGQNQQQPHPQRNEIHQTNINLQQNYIQQTSTPRDQYQGQVPSFGGEHTLKTFDERRASAGIKSEKQQVESNQDSERCFGLASKRTAHAPQMEPSFTPDRDAAAYTHMDKDSSEGAADPMTPFLNAYSIQMLDSPFVPQSTAQLGKQDYGNEAESPQYNDYMEEDSLNEPSCAVDCKEKNEVRANFIMEKAQAITENINSCYKQHNMPKIDMATIQKLKMRRMDFLQQNMPTTQDQTSPAAFIHNQPKPQQRQSKKPTKQQAYDYTGNERLPVTQSQLTQQSCNVKTTMTVETSQTEGDEYELSPLKATPTNLQDISFTEALNNLKAEVASLMQHRVAGRQ